MANKLEGGGEDGKALVSGQLKKMLFILRLPLERESKFRGTEPANERTRADIYINRYIQSK